MKADPPEDIPAQIEQILNDRAAPLPASTVYAYVEDFVDRRQDFLSLAEEHGSPLYVFDEPALRERAQAFRRAFERVAPRVSCYFAVKSNNHPLVTRTLLTEHFGLDVSSGVELQAALVAGADDIVLSGPGKTLPELSLAVENAERVTVLIDSFGELERLAEMARSSSTRIRAGVRITPPSSDWRKFGVPLERLRPFWQRAGQLESVDLCGLQFHTSWNHRPAKQMTTIEAIGREIRRWPKLMRKQIAFLDMGGGFWPPQGEWLLDAATPRGKLLSLVKRNDGLNQRCTLVEAEPIEAFSENLAKCLEEHVFNSGVCDVYLEPGRWICNSAMHLLLTVVDKKEDDLVIVDAGTSAVGWERFESDYVPLVNLSRPAMQEIPCQVLGSLCTPHDVWGYAFWGKEILPGDVLLVPDQGAYTYSLRQEFIKPVPSVVSLDRCVKR
ncbi:MAG: alanine racemase [Pirellulales bacterium]